MIRRTLGRMMMCLGLALAIFIGVLFVLRPACACLPISYYSVSLDTVPEAYLQKFEELSGGVTPARAWRYDTGERTPAMLRGYLIRGTVSWRKSKDIRISAYEALGLGPNELEPIPAQ